MGSCSSVGCSLGSLPVAIYYEVARYDAVLRGSALSMDRVEENTRCGWALMRAVSKCAQPRAPASQLRQGI